MDRTDSTETLSHQRRLFRRRVKTVLPTNNHCFRHAQLHRFHQLRSNNIHTIIIPHSHPTVPLFRGLHLCSPSPLSPPPEAKPLPELTSLPDPSYRQTRCSATIAPSGLTGFRRYSPATISKVMEKRQKATVFCLF